MITPKILYLKMDLLKGSRDLVFTASYLICGEWVGKDPSGLQAHVEELVRLGVPAPRRIPIYLNLSTYLLTTDNEVTVVSDLTSGEIEYVLLCSGNETWVTVGSDHTDRDVEKKSIPGSKQMYAKCLAPECWPYPDVRKHWDKLILRCWTTKGARRTLYQETLLSEVLDPQELMEKMPCEGVDKKEGFVLFSGTIPTKGGLIFGDSYELELEDAVLNRAIRHTYRVKILPQYV